MTIDLADPDSAADGTFVHVLSDLVNLVYAVAEDGLWRDGAARTSPGEIAALIAAGEMLVARTTGETVVGCVRVHDVAADTSEFGLLAAAPDQRSHGIGRALVDEAERRSRERSMTTMQLELLVPRGWKHPSKELLAAWYARRGYRLVETVAFEGPYPHLAPLLATPCDLQIHRKLLD